MPGYRSLWLLSAATALAATHCATAENGQGLLDLRGDGSVAMGGTGNAPPDVTGGNPPVNPPVTSGGNPPVTNGGQPGGGAGGTGNDCGGALKRCAGICIPPGPGVGCDMLACAPCPSAPANATGICTGDQCDFECDSGYVRGGASCVMGSGGSGGGTSVDPCADGVMNGSESDVDCGGVSCSGCAPGRACATDSDCARGPCETDGTCGCTPDTCASSGSCAASFNDGCGNTVDCSGSCVAPATCYQDACCTAATACDPTTCSATFDDGCGGTLDCTDNCVATDVCYQDACCTPVTQCDATATCGHTTDGCGTPFDCPVCADGGPCAAGDDCESTICEAGLCVSCTDGKMNNGETDADCGGPNCGPCDSQKKCQSDADCLSGTCCAAFGPAACILQPGNTCL